MTADRHDSVPIFPLGLHHSCHLESPLPVQSEHPMTLPRVIDDAWSQSESINDTLPDQLWRSRARVI